MSPALAGRFFTTDPPGKPSFLYIFFYLKQLYSVKVWQSCVGGRCTGICFYCSFFVCWITSFTRDLIGEMHLKPPLQSLLLPLLYCAFCKNSDHSLRFPHLKGRFLWCLILLPGTQRLIKLMDMTLFLLTISVLIWWFSHFIQSSLAELQWYLAPW